MVPNPFRKLLGHDRPEPRADLSAALADLDRLGRDRPELEAAARTLGRVLAAAFGPPGIDAERTACLLDILETQLREAAYDEVPILRRVPFFLTDGRISERARAICRVLEREGGAPPGVGRLFKDGVEVLRLLGWLVEGQDAEIDAWAVARGIETPQLHSVLRLATLPDLAEWTAQFERRWPSRPWSRGDCPQCGRPPLLAESRGLEGARFLRCGLCAAGWAFDRVRCPACGSSDPRRLRVVHVEGEEGRCRRAECLACGHRLKVASTLAPLSPPGLVVMELATIHLDLLPDAATPADPAIE